MDNMWFVYSISGIFITFTLAQNCDKLGVLVYDDLGCLPNQFDDDYCPNNYTCDNLEPKSENCALRDKIYKNKEIVSDELSNPSCQSDCTCTTENGISKFSCNRSFSCDEWSKVPKSGCHYKYSLDKCCALDTSCPPFSNIAACVDGGKTYKEGEIFYPKDTCLKCVCQKGFKGRYREPHCKKLDCGIQLGSKISDLGYQFFRKGDEVQKSCAPFYASNVDDVLCCPHHWICSDGTEKIEGNAKSEDVCKFGDKTLKVGQKFTKTNVIDDLGREFQNVECECVVPPLARCLLKV